MAASLKNRSRANGALFAAALLLGAAPVSAECRPTEALRCTLELQGKNAPRVGEVCNAEAWREHLRFEQPERLADRNGDGWWEAVLRLDLRPEHGCRCAVVRVELARDRRLFVLDVGDSPTNDGYGGDAGTSAYSAEVQLFNDLLFVYSTGRLGAIDELLRLELEPPPRIFELEVCDQFVGFTARTGAQDPRPLKGQMSTAMIRHLFALGAGPAGETDNSIYVGLNRVIHQRDAAPAQGRYGVGVERVELFLSP